jgi:hypothetical protein
MVRATEGRQVKLTPSKARKGPGMKEYHLTLYALSAEPAFTHEYVTRVDLLRSIKDITLAESTLSWKYKR